VPIVTAEQDRKGKKSTVRRPRKALVAVWIHHSTPHRLNSPGVQHVTYTALIPFLGTALITRPACKILTIDTLTSPMRVAMESRTLYDRRDVSNTRQAVQPRSHIALSYFNEAAGGPRNGADHLLDANID
jgi:hypothetical protein